MTETPEQPQHVPPAFQSPNGHTPAREAIEMVRSLVAQMPQMLAQAFASVLSQVPVQMAGGRPNCTQCGMSRLAWLAAHQQETDAAQAAYQQAAAELAGLPDDDPRKGLHLDAALFLPEHLRPGASQGIPVIQEGLYMVNGAMWCLHHMPGAPGRTQLLVARAGLRPSMFANLAA